MIPDWKDPWPEDREDQDQPPDEDDDDDNESDRDDSGPQYDFNNSMSSSRPSYDPRNEPRGGNRKESRMSNETTSGRGKDSQDEEQEMKCLSDLADGEDQSSKNEDPGVWG